MINDGRNNKGLEYGFQENPSFILIPLSTNELDLTVYK